MKICQNCNKEFPSSYILNGVKHNFQNRKYCLECSPFKQHNTCKLHTINAELPKEKLCKHCNTVKSIDNFFVRSDRKHNSVYPWCKSCNNKQVLLRQKKNKLDCLNYKNNICCICGYNKCQDSMDFHHMNPLKKDFNISKVKCVKLNNKIKKELDKCILVCSNCHREIHAGFTKIPDDIINKFNIENLKE